MRAIKFRVWDKEEKRYIYRTLRELLNGIGNDCPDWESSAFRHLVLFGDAIPEASIGLCDKNGKEIWEDDLYKTPDGIVYRIQMAVDGWGLFSKTEKGAVKSLYWENVCTHTQGEVIGNIHENPELLEKSKG